MLRNDVILLICDFWKKKFRENFGAILDFPGNPNESKFLDRGHFNFIFRK